MLSYTATAAVLLVDLTFSGSNWRLLSCESTGMLHMLWSCKPTQQHLGDSLKACMLVSAAQVSIADHKMVP